MHIKMLLVFCILIEVKVYGMDEAEFKNVPKMEHMENVILVNGKRKGLGIFVQ